MAGEAGWRLRDKVVVVTGGASGIGEAVCRLFADEGATVIAGDLNGNGVAAVASAITESGGVCVAVECDVSSGAGVDRLVETASGQYGRLDAVIACAGRPSPVGLAEMTEEEWDTTFAVNVKSVALLSQRAAPLMSRSGQGAIVTIGSAAALVIMPGQPAYCASKGAVITLTKALAAELAEKRIRVNCICPGIVRTPMLLRYFEELYPDSEHRKTALAELERPEAIGRMAEPSEIATAALFLASQEASYVNGAVLSVDGGLTAIK